MKKLKHSLKPLLLLVLSTLVINASAQFGDDNEDNEFGRDDTDIGLSDFSGRIEGNLERESARRKAVIIDESFELGKSIYYGRKEGIPKLSYCINIDDQKKKLKTKSIKPYKNSSFSDLARSLYNCDTPEKQIIADLQRSDFLYVLYYLDQRYELNLKRE